MGKICCFAGHNEVSDTSNVYEKIRHIVEHLIIEEGVEEFLVGDYGDFNEISKKAILEAKVGFPEIKLNCVIPYNASNLNEYHYLHGESYNKIFTVEVPKNAPLKFSFIKCNEYMIDNSEYMICYVWKEWGGGAKALKYAKEKNIKIYNIA